MVEGDQLEFNHVSIYDDDVKERNPSVEKARDGFGWEPEMKLEDSLAECIDNLDNLY